MPGPKTPKVDVSGSISTEAIGAVSEFRFKKFSLQVIEGPDVGSSADFDGTELSVGTSAANELVLSDPTASRHHFTISGTDEGIELRDLESKNGTHLGPYRVMSAYLEQPVTLRAGHTTLRFEVSNQEVGVPIFNDISWSRVLGKSAPMRRLFALLLKIARTDSTVLLEGETGVGKGLVAQSIHKESARSGGPLIEVDCASIPASLIESELFGHEEGAFTGATTARAGAFEQAAGGTIFLDEIGELPLSLQPKLLRALEDRKVKRVGGNVVIPLDVRIVAATNRDLRQAVNRGAFRSDLFYRLDILRLKIPALRERREDIPLLAAHFWDQMSEGGGQPPPQLIEELSLHDWPGNVRELHNAIERAVITGDPDLWRGIGEAPEKEAAPSANRLFDPAVAFRDAKTAVVAQWERAYVEDLLARNAGSIVRAARAAKMDRTYLRQLARRYGLEQKNS